MNPSRLAALFLASILHLAPFAARTVPSLPALVSSPAGILFKWFLGAVAVTGSMHTVSAATAVLASATSVSGKVGTRLSYQIRINDGKNRSPGSWVIGGTTYPKTGTTTNRMPPGLSLALSTAIISGIPTTTGTHPVTLTAYEDPNRGGAKLTFTVTFSITEDSSPPAITSQPLPRSLHPGEPLTLAVTATGSTPLTYAWRFLGNILPNAPDAPTLTLPAISETDAGTYDVVISGPGGTITSNPATLTVVPLRLGTPSPDSANLRFNATTIPGRTYILEATDDPGSLTWSPVLETIASSDITPLTQPLDTSASRTWRLKALP